MKRIIIPLLISMIVFMGCEKGDSKHISTENIELNSPKGIVFFESKSKMVEEVKTVIGNDFGKLERFVVIKVEYYEDKTKSLAHITYEANGTEHKNIIFLKTSQQKTSFKCTATNCLCQLDVYPDGNGQYVYECGGCSTNCHFEITQN